MRLRMSVAGVAVLGTGCAWLSGLSTLEVDDAVDASVDVDVDGRLDGGAPMDGLPNEFGDGGVDVIHCGSTQCKLGSEVCCYLSGIGLPSDASCGPLTGSCAGVPIPCDRTDQCEGGVCCATVNSALKVSAVACTAPAKCPIQTLSTKVRLCRTSAECGTSGTCTVGLTAPWLGYCK